MDNAAAEIGGKYILVTYGYADESGSKITHSAIVGGSAQFRMPGKRMVDVYFRQGGRPGLGMIGDGVFASYSFCEEPEITSGKESGADPAGHAYVEYGDLASGNGLMKAIVNDNTILDFVRASGSTGRTIVRIKNGKWTFVPISWCDGATFRAVPYNGEIKRCGDRDEVVAKRPFCLSSTRRFVGTALARANIAVPKPVNVRVEKTADARKAFNSGTFRYEDLDFGIPKKCAFAIYAKGKSHERFKANLIDGLERHVPGIDIVNLNIDEASAFLPGLSGRMLVLFARLAIPLMRQFRKYDRVIWIDVDTDIQSGMFAGILDVETGDGGLAAVADMYNGRYRAMLKRRFKSYKSKVYFNSGLIVFDLLKINKSLWENTLLSGIAEFNRRRFSKEDQDLLNAYFDITEIDVKYNYIWGRGKDGAKSAWMVHYCASGGHRDFSKILDGREESGYWATNSLKRRCVVTALRSEFAKSWIRAYFASGNTAPLVIIPGDPGGFGKETMEYCKSAAEFCGGMVLDCSYEWNEGRRLKQRASVGWEIGWYTKKLFLLKIARDIAPKTWAWVDDDAEITGNIDECFRLAESAPGFIYTQFYRPRIDDRQHPAKFFRTKKDKMSKMNWGSFTFFHGDANERISDEFCKDFPVEDDESIMAYLYRHNRVWHEGFCDFSKLNWQKTCKKISQIPRSWSGKVLHYASCSNKRAVKNMWGKKCKALPAAPFEAYGKVPAISIRPEEYSRSVTFSGNAEYDDPSSPVDAVFVIGNGSKNGNEELRYALRNLDAHCKFVRNVYICGECPKWVDTSVVRHLKWPDRFRHAKDANIIDKLRHACEFPGMARKVLFCSDDQFQTRECTWDDFYPRFLRQYNREDKWYEAQHRVWHDRLRDTLDREFVRRMGIGLDTSQVFYWQPHIWMQIDRDRFVQYAKWCGYQHRKDTIIASGYFNYIGATPKRNSDHVFVGRRSKGLPKETHVAYSDGGFDYAMSILRSMFPEKCRFERGAEFHVATSIKNLSVVKVLELK